MKATFTQRSYFFILSVCVWTIASQATLSANSASQSHLRKYMCRSYFVNKDTFLQLASQLTSLELSQLSVLAQEYAKVFGKSDDHSNQIKRHIEREALALNKAILNRTSGSLKILPFLKQLVSELQTSQSSDRMSALRQAILKKSVLEEQTNITERLQALYEKYNTQDINKAFLQSIKASSIENSNLAEVEFLVERGANIDYAENGYGGLYYTIARTEDLSILEFLLIKNVSYMPVNEMSLLMLACNHSADNLVDFFISRETEIDRKDKDGRTALTIASQKRGNKVIIEKLLRAGANIHHKDEYGRTALLEAAINGRKDNVLVLLANQANIHDKNKSGQTALDVAIEYQRNEVIEILRRYEGIQHLAEEAANKLLSN